MKRYAGAEARALREAATRGDLLHYSAASLVATVGVLAETVETLDAELSSVTSQRNSSFGYVENIDAALNEGGVDDVVAEWSGHPEEPPCGRQADPLERVHMLIGERDGWRARVEALEAERDALTETVRLLGERLDRHSAERAESYQSGRADERAEVVAWLRKQAHGDTSMTVSEAAALIYALHKIESGAHEVNP